MSFWTWDDIECVWQSKPQRYMQKKRKSQILKCCQEKISFGGPKNVKGSNACQKAMMAFRWWVKFNEAKTCKISREWTSCRKIGKFILLDCGSAKIENKKNLQILDYIGWCCISCDSIFMLEYFPSEEIPKLQKSMERQYDFPSSTRHAHLTNAQRDKNSNRTTHHDRTEQGWICNCSRHKTHLPN